MLEDSLTFKTKAKIIAELLSFFTLIAASCPVLFIEGAYFP